MRVVAVVAAIGLSGCATGTFRISAEDQLSAEQAANFEEMAILSSAGISGTWIVRDWRGGACRWSRNDPTVATCRTATRFIGDERWRPTTERYRRNEDGKWRFAPQDTLRR